MESTRIEIGSATIHRIVEQEGAFFDALQFFPTMTKELLDKIRKWLQPRFLDAQDRLPRADAWWPRRPRHTTTHR
jgi:hypothetical protein